jgi:hypothetical protein
VFCVQRHSIQAKKRAPDVPQASATLTKLKIAFPFLNEVSCEPLQQSLRHQQRALRNLAPEASEVPKIQEKDRPAVC